MTSKSGLFRLVAFVAVVACNLFMAMSGLSWVMPRSLPSHIKLQRGHLLPLLILACNTIIYQAVAQDPPERQAFKHLFKRDPSRSPSATNLRQTSSPTSSAAPTTLIVTSSPTILQVVTPAPSPDPFPPIDPPADYYDPSYFNYDTSLDAEYGPGYPALELSDVTNSFQQVYQNNAWATRETPMDDYWREFDNATEGGFGPYEGVLASYDPAVNRCGNVGAQSPIDLSENSECYERHQIRTISGDLSLNSTMKVQKLIEGNKLRLVYERNCENCLDTDIPRSDFPHDWPDFTDVINVDLKVPSEHTIYGKRYDAEWQVFHLHRARERTPVVGVVMSAEDDEYNIYLQDALDAFQHVYNVDRANCARRIRKQRRLVTRIHRILGGNTKSEVHDYDTWADFSTEFEQPEFATLHANMERKLHKTWSPLDQSLVPSIYFFGYEGSLTEPPCGEWVSWRIIDTPMKIAKFQLDQIKTLLFTHVGPDCTKTSLHWKQGVARPLQDAAGRPIWRCTPANFLSDAENRDLNMTTRV